MLRHISLFVCLCRLFVTSLWTLLKILTIVNSTQTNTPNAHKSYKKYFGPRLFRPEAYPAQTLSKQYPAYASFKLCKFIGYHPVSRNGFALFPICREWIRKSVPRDNIFQSTPHVKLLYSCGLNQSSFLSQKYEFSLQFPVGHILFGKQVNLR